MMLAVGALSCRRALRFKGWRWQSPVATWKHMRPGRHNGVITFATKNTRRKRRNFQNESNDSLLVSEEASSGSGGSASTSLEVNSGDVATDDQISVAPRSSVLQACTLTSSLLLGGGLLLREASHLASLNGWPIADPTDVSFNFETWHLELIAGLVIVISSSRYILLQTWSDFRDSSEAANTQEVGVHHGGDKCLGGEGHIDDDQVLHMKREVVIKDNWTQGQGRETVVLPDCKPELETVVAIELLGAAT